MTWIYICHCIGGVVTSHPKPSEPLIGLSWPPVGRIYLYSRSGRGRGQGNAVANVAMCESSGCGNDSTSGRIHRAAAPPEDTHRSHSPSALRAAPSRQDGLPGVADAAQVGPPVSAGAGSGFWRGVRVRTEAAGEGMRGMANFCGLWLPDFLCNDVCPLGRYRRRSSCLSWFLR